jgi:hypothetical protein
MPSGMAIHTPATSNFEAFEPKACHTNMPLLLQPLMLRLCKHMHAHPRSQPSVTPKSNHTPQASDSTKSKAINSHALGNMLTLACTSAIQPEQPQHWANEQVNPQGDHGHLSLKASIKRSCNMSLYTLECMPALHMGVWPHMGCMPYNTVLKSTRSQQELGTTL